jgi:threonine dehydrogenase-like Zn-dependent dehydrogenase
MPVRAAVVAGRRQRAEIADAALDDPRAGEVEMAVAAAGVCDTGLHVVAGDCAVPMPVVFGHEGAVSGDELPELPVTLPPVGGRVVHQAQRAMEEEMR